MKRALIIGKDKINNELNPILPLVNYQVTAKTTNGIEALRMVQRVEPDLVICSWDTAGISALDLAQNLVHSRVAPVVFIIDEKDYIHLNTAVKTGVHHILIAPLRATDVVSGIIQAEHRYHKEIEYLKESNKLKEEIKTRKLVYRAVLRLVFQGMDEETAYSAIRSRAMASQKTIRAIADDVINGRWKP